MSARKALGAFHRQTTMAEEKDYVVVPWTRTVLTGMDLLRNPRYSKGMAFTREERHALRLRGLLPARPSTLEHQAQRVMWSLNQKSSPLEKYVYFMGLLERNEKLFYHVLINNVVELMPIVYTPTVGEACQKFGNVFSQPRSLWVSINDLGQVHTLLRNWPEQRVKAIVFTDGERILGLGDLGAFGMGIPIGKLALYTACAGLHPKYLLPVHIDVGCDVDAIREHTNYIGLRQKRDRSEKYDQLIEEFMTACTERYGESVLLQFEDFGNRNALRLLEKFKTRFCTFNDDIQGTAAVGLAGIYAAVRLKKEKLSQQVFVLLGAGSAGVGIASLISYAIEKDENVSPEEARSRVWLIDSRGLVVKGRSSGGISSAKMPFAHPHEELKSLEDIVKSLKATCIIGVSAQPKTFTEGVCRAMAKNTERPIIFPMSNPTTKSECSAADAFAWTGNNCIFASGSPFPPVTYQKNGRTITCVPSQGNNSYIFPGLALGVVATKARRIPDPDFFLVAAKALARQVSEADLQLGQIYPPMKEIRNVSIYIAMAIAKAVFDCNLNNVAETDDLHGLIMEEIYRHEAYGNYVDSGLY